MGKIPFFITFTHEGFLPLREKTRNIKSLKNRYFTHPTLP